MAIGAALLVGCSQEPVNPADSTDSDAGSLAVDVGYQRADVSSSDAAPWPTESDASLPSCTAWSDAWALPDLAVADAQGLDGVLKLVASSPLQPLGHEETVTLSVLKADGALDYKATDKITLNAASGITIVEAGPLTVGNATIRIKLTKPGPQLLSASLPDGRIGRIKLWGYTTQLPVWRIDVSDTDLATLYAKTDEKLWVPVTLHLSEVTTPGQPAEVTTHTGKMRLHGGSSKTFPKKSFRLNLDKDQRLVDGRRKLILRAEYADKTMLRNFTAYELLRHGTWLPTSRTTYIHVRLGARYHGVMLHPDRIDGHFLEDNGLSDTGSLYEADPPFEKSVPGGNLTVPKSSVSYGELYQHHEGDLDYQDLIELIEVVLRLPDAEFAENADRVIKVDDVLVFLAFTTVIQNQDWVKKNYYLYRDPKAVDSRWSLIAWDLDLSFGHLWTKENDVLDEHIFTDGNPYIGMYDGHDFYNQLVDRLLWVKPFRQRYRSFVAHLIAGQFSPGFLDVRIDNALCRMQPDLLADRLKRAKNAEIPGLAQELRDYVPARQTWLKTWLSEPDPMD